MGLATLLLLVCAGGTGMTLAADRSGRRQLEFWGKPLAAAAFILAGWHWGALDSGYGQLILAGLVFGALGDVLLIPAGTGKLFLGGMAAFALGHLFYVIAFASLPLPPIALGLALLSMAVVMAGILRWLMPHVPPRFKWPVLAYVLIIAAMLITAVAATAGGAHPLIALGAIGFALSDIAVARHRFVAPGFVNRVWGLPLYFCSQMLIASTVLWH